MDNLRFIFANEANIAWQDSYFDIAILDGIMKWVAPNESDDPALKQKRLLKKIFGLLKPGGTIYVGIEDRFHWIKAR